MASRRRLPEINAGSMADIAFLLLLFFLVATTISTDKGINRTLPEPCPPNSDCVDTIKDNNLLRISINGDNLILINDKLTSLDEVKDITMAFINNNKQGNCDYCNSNPIDTYSDHPKQAVISISNTNDTSYAFYIAVQDELTKAYLELRLGYALSVLNKTEDQLSDKDLKTLKDVYPFKLSEASK